MTSTHLFVFTRLSHKEYRRTLILVGWAGMPCSSGRVVKGGAAERSGCLHPGDEVLEVNGLRLKGKSVHDICSTLCQARGTTQSLSEKELSPNLKSSYTDTKGVGKSRPIRGCRSTKCSMQRKTFFLPLREISHHTGFFSGRFPIPKDGIFPPCRNFSDHFPIPKAGITGVKASFKVGLKWG